MAKSMRSKSKRSFRRTKRETGVYAVTHAARIDRLSAKLVAKINQDADGDVKIGEPLENGGSEEAVGCELLDMFIPGSDAWFSVIGLMDLSLFPGSSSSGCVFGSGTSLNGMQWLAMAIGEQYLD